MAALIVLELRLLWRSAGVGLRFAVIFIPMMAAIMLSTEQVPLQSLGSFVLMPAFFFTIIGMVAIQGAESLAWLAPLRIFTRIQARFWLFAGLGSLHSALLLGLHAITGNTPREPWIQLALHSWLCFMGSGLLLFTLADLSRAQHGFVRTLAFIVAISPGYGMSVAHVVHGTPAWVLALEAVVVAALLGVNLLIHEDQEPASRAPLPGESTDVPSTRAPSPAGKLHSDPLTPIPALERRIPEILPAPAAPRLDHVADPGPVLFGSLFAYVSIWLLMVGWLTVSFVPVPFFYFTAGCVLLPGILLRVLHHWAPFQATPISRPAVLRRLFIPVLLLWGVTLGIQGATIWYDRPTVVSGDELRLPFVKRECEAFLPPQFRENTPYPERKLPGSPQAVAPLMSQALRLSYGIDIPAGEILAIRPSVPLDGSSDPIQRAWLLEVETRWEAAIRWKLLQWRIAAGLLVLLVSLISIAPALRGRWPRWLTQAFQWVLFPIWTLPMFWVVYGKVLSRIPAPLRTLYGELFDRPWILITIPLILSTLLLIRHARAFCIHSVDLPPIKKRAQEFM